jgi:hypothetical protein
MQQAYRLSDHGLIPVSEYLTGEGGHVCCNTISVRFLQGNISLLRLFWRMEGFTVIGNPQSEIEKVNGIHGRKCESYFGSTGWPAFSHSYQPPMST